MMTSNRPNTIDLPSISTNSNIVGCSCWNIRLNFIELNNRQNDKEEFPDYLNKGRWVQLVAQGIKIGFLNLVKILSIDQYRSISCFNCGNCIYSYKVQEGQTEGHLTPEDQIVYLHNDQFDLKYFESIKNNDQFSQVFECLYSVNDFPTILTDDQKEIKSAIRDHTLEQYLKKRKLVMLEKIEAFKQQQLNEFKALEKTAKLHYNYLVQKTQQNNLFTPESINKSLPKDTHLITPLTDDVSTTPPTHSLTTSNHDLDFASSIKISEIDHLMNLSKHQTIKSVTSSKVVSPIQAKQEIEDDIPEETQEDKDDMFVMDEDIPQAPKPSKISDSSTLTSDPPNASNFYSRPGTSFKSSKYMDRDVPNHQPSPGEHDQEESIATMATSVPVAILYSSKLTSSTRSNQRVSTQESLDEDQINPISATFVAPHVLSSRTLKDDKEKLFGDVPSSKTQREFLYN